MPNYAIQTKLQRPEQTRIRPKTYTNESLFSLKTLLIELNRKPRTKAQLAEDIGLSSSTVSRWIRILHAGYPFNVVHIVNWRPPKGSGCPAAIFGLGIGLPDEPRPRPKTQKEYDAKRAAKKAKTLRIIQVKDGVIQHVTERRHEDRREGKERRSDLS